jgi:Histidinol-phosphate/aromatic aminotransferase and cobyric acid decarboxylase
LAVNPTYGDPYSKAAQIGRETIKVPLNKDYTQNIPAIIDIAEQARRGNRVRLHRQPEQPDGDDRPEGSDQAAARRHPEGHAGAHRRGLPPLRRHPGLRVVHEVRPRRTAGHRLPTFSKIAALAAMRLGYGIAPAELIKKVRTFTTGSQSITVKFGGAASLKDKEGQAKTRR